ncbi:MAG: hypothetical protein J0I21_03625 [Alphaproteobacteria bacterium]|nr:hypothetical protein [Alphaproteobacteria bacterium]
MSSFAILTLAAAGHVNPTLAIVADLVDRGSRVFYFAPTDVRERIEGVGATWVDRPRPVRSAMSGGQSLGNDAIRRLPYLMAAAAPRTTPPLAEQLETLGPAVVLCNELDLTARLAARAVQQRVATFRPFHAVPRRNAAAVPIESDLIEGASRGIENWATRYGLGNISLEDALTGDERLRLMFLPRAFQSGAEGFNDTHLFVGPSIAAPSPVPWPFPPRHGNQPLHVYISLGTLRNNRPDFYRLCFDAFSGSEWEVVMSIGQQTDRATLGPAPENFDVRAFAPQLALLAHTDVFITHGGLNSVMEAIWSGVPIVALPEIDEQRLTARRIQELGLGCLLEHEGLSSQCLRSTAHQMASDSLVKSNINAMRSEARAAGGAARASVALLRFSQTDAWR